MKWFIYFFATVLGLSFLFAPEPTPVDLETFTSKTTSDSRMYFQNVRSFYYDIFPRERAPMVIYKLARRNKNPSEAELQFNIIQNPQTGQAFVFGELLAVQVDSSYQIKVKREQEDFTSAIHNINMEQHYKLAAAVHNAILNEKEIILLKEKRKVKNLFKDYRKRKYTGVVLEDFFKLIRKK